MTVKQDPERGTWTVVVYTGFVAGKRQQVWRRGFKTERAARKAEAKLITDHDRGLTVKTSRTTVERYLVDVWLPAKVPTLKPSTLASYRQMIDHLFWTSQWFLLFHDKARVPINYAAILQMPPAA